MLPNKLPLQKIIAFDVDGTVTASKSPITSEMAGLIKHILEEKIVVAISGGSFHQFQTQFLPPFKVFISGLSNLKILPTSGSQRYEYNETSKDWERTDLEPLPLDVKQKALKLLKEIIDSGLYDIPTNPVGDIVEDRGTQITFSACGQQAPIEMKSAWDPTQEKRKKIKAVLEPELPGVSILINAYSSIDILPKGFNKAVGLHRFLNKMGLQKTDMIFLGDGLFPGGNDYSVYEAGIETIAVKGPEETAEIFKGWLG